MKKSIVLALMLLGFATLAFSQPDDALLSKKVELDKKEASIQWFMDALSAKYGIVFSFEPALLNTSKIVVLNSNNPSVREILNKMLENTGLIYTVRSQVIVISKAPAVKPKPKKVTISGIIKDAGSAETLVGTTVYSLNTKTGEISNQYGFYSVPLFEGSNQVQFSCVGYETLVIDTVISADTRFDVLLKPSTVEMDEVVVINKQSKMLDFKQGFTRIETNAVKSIPAIFGEADVIKAVLVLPGVNNTSELGGNFQVRGGSWDQNLMLLDEAIVYNCNHLFGLYSVYNPEMLKDIKFYKGGIPASYGGRVSSVIDVTQKDGDMKNYHFSGSVGVIAVGGTAEGPIVNDKSSFFISARRSIFEPYMKYVKNDNAKELRPYFYDINSKVNYIFDANNRLYFSWYIGGDVMSVSSLQAQSYGNYTGTLRFNHIFNDKLFSNTSLIFSSYNMSVDMRDTFPWQADLGLEHYELKSDFLYMQSRHRMKFGVQSIFYVFHPGERVPLTANDISLKVNIDDQYAIESALFFDDNIKISEKIELQAGLRFSNYNCIGNADVYKYVDGEPLSNTNIIDTISYKNGEIYKTYNGLEPRVSLKFNIAQGQAVTASYNHIKQYVQLVSRTFSPQPCDMWKPSNSYIKPLEADQVSVGWLKQWKDRGFDISIESFYKWLDNVIEAKAGTEVILNPNLDAAIVQGTGRAYGIEFAANKRKGRFTGIFSYTWSRSLRKVDGNSLEEKVNLGKEFATDYDIPHKINIIGEYELSKRVSLTANFIYQTGRPLSYPSGQFIYMNNLMSYYAGKNMQRYNDFHRLDLGVVVRNRPKPKRKWQSSWNFSVYNVYNRENEYFNGIRYKNGTRDTEAVSLWIFNVVPSVTYNFKF